MGKYYVIFNKENPELVKEFKQFIIKINKYLTEQANDPKYHASMTKGESKERSLTIQENEWEFIGKQQYENPPLTDEAAVYYNGTPIWSMERTSALRDSEDLDKDAAMDRVQHCLREISENFDRDRPWCGPRYYTDGRGLHYEVTYSGNDEEFELIETIHDGLEDPLWSATCKGGFTK